MTFGKQVIKTTPSSSPSTGILTSVVIIAIVCLAISLYLSGTDHAATAALNDTVLTVFKMASGALIAVLAQRR